MKKIVALLLAFEFCVPVLAVEPAEDGFDTLSISMEDYYESTKQTETILRIASDDAAIESVCEAFIAVGRASVRSREYSIVAFSDSSCEQVAYRQSEFQYLAALNEATEVTILRDDLQFSDFKTEIDGNAATASVVEKYTYYTDNFDGYNFKMRKYDFDLIKQNDGSWTITGVITDDPWEVEDYPYEPYNVSEAAISANRIATVNMDADVNRLGGKTAVEVASGLYKWTYNTAAAVEYAEHFYSATAAGGYNALFPFQVNANGGAVNCQNFASQCVWAGLIGDCDTALAMSSRTTLPAVTANRAGNDAENVWSFEDGYTSAYNGCPWISSTRFAKMIKNSKTTTEGPFGNTHYGNLKYADVGDVIHIRWDGGVVTETSTLDHAMFVTQATGSVGSRTASNLKIAANSSPTNSAYMDLSSYAAGYNDSSFSTSVISDGYYSSVRNFN